MPVSGSGLQQTHGVLAILTQAIGQDGTGPRTALTFEHNEPPGGELTVIGYANACRENAPELIGIGAWACHSFC